MITILAYRVSTDKLVESPQIADLPALLADEDVLLWVNLFQAEPQEIAVLHDVFHLDAMAIEDCIHPRQSPKLESFPDYHFFIVHGVIPPNGAPDFQMIELSGFLGDRYLITYHDEPVPSVETAKSHIISNNSRMNRGTAFLAYEILDRMIDMFLPVLDHFDERLQDIENEIHDQPFGDTSAREYIKLSGHLLDLRRISVKNQQVFYQFSHSPLRFIDAAEARLFRDVYDHVVRVVDMSEYYQQSLRGALDIQLSLSSNRVNQVVQFLTIFATIMLPLNVITGIYGMNFDWMPFLHNPNGFWIIVTLMVVIVLALMRSFRKRGWI